MKLGSALDLRRKPSNHHKVEMVELFFDLVFVFAVTQLSHALLADVSPANAGQVGLLLLATWWAWIFTSWCTNWLDPQLVSVRVLLFALMLAGLVMSAAIPHAFDTKGHAFGIAFAVTQVGRTSFVLWALRRHHEVLFRNFVRIWVWLVASGSLWVAGSFADDEARIALWGTALAIEYTAPLVAFWTPGLGRSQTSEWDISPAHMAERCALFIIIALGESILVTGATFAELPWRAATVAAFGAAFVGSIAMWWIYFNIGAEEAHHRFEKADDRGRVAREAYTYMHLPIVAGIVVSAVGDELVLAHPSGHTDAKTGLTVIGGAALFLAGNVLFKHATARRWPLSHLAGFGALAAIAAAAPVLPPVATAWLTTAALVMIATWETRSLQSVRARLRAERHAS